MEGIMKVIIGSEVFEGEDLAHKVLTCKASEKDFTIAIIGEDENGERIFSAAIKGEELPETLNQLWDLLPQIEKCVKCEARRIAKS